MRIVFIFFLLGTALACQVSDLELSSKKKNDDTSTELIPSPLGMKVSPGKMNSTATDMAVHGTITTKDQKFQLGTDMAITLSISQGRSTAQ